MANTTQNKRDTKTLQTVSEDINTKNAQSEETQSRKAIRKYTQEFNTDLNNHDYYISDFDAYEAMLASRTWDSVSQKTKSGITDGATTTIYLERAARVVGQLPTGQVSAFGKKDKGKAALMDIILQRYIYPHATGSGWSFLEKVRQWQFYSSVYGFMPMYYDWEVSDDGYIGPNCYLWSPRLFVPQTGRSSIGEMDHVHGLVYMSPIEIENLIDDLKDTRGDNEPDEADPKENEDTEVEPKANSDTDDDDGWDMEGLKVVLRAANNSGDGKGTDTKRATEGERHNQAEEPDGVLFATRYEAGPDGRWITFCPNHGDIVVRDIPNPHKNNKIPFVLKHSLPLFDSVYGLGDFQRARPIQGAMDGLTNFYFEGIKTNIYQPIVVNANGVIKSTISQNPGAIMQETQPNSIRRLETSTAGLNTYQSTMTQFKGSLLNQAGTTDTTVNKDSALDPGFGKTPQALAALSSRESARDNQDRFFLEQALEELLNSMVGLIPNMASEAIPVNLFSADIQAIRDAGLADVDEMLEMSESQNSAKLTINPEALEDVQFRFFLDSGSTAKADKQAQLQSIQTYMSFLAQNQNVVQQLNQQGKTIDLVALSTMYGSLSDVPGMDKIIRQMDQNEQKAYETSQAPKPDHPKVNVNLRGDLTGTESQETLQQYGIQVSPPTPDPGTSPMSAMMIGGRQFSDPHVARTAHDLIGLAQQHAMAPQAQPQDPQMAQQPQGDMSAAQ